MTTRIKLIVILSVVLAAAFLSTSLITYFVSTAQYRSSSVREILPLLTNNILTEVQRDLMLPIDVSSLMATDTFLRDWVLDGETDLQAIQQYLAEIADKYAFFTAFFVSDGTGKYYYPGGILKTIGPDDAHDDWYYTFRASNADVDLDVDTDEAHAGTLTIFFNHRVLDYEGNLLGVTGVGLSVAHLSALLSQYHAEFGRLVYMVDSKGLVQAHPDSTLVNTASILDTVGIRDVAQEILVTHSGSTSHEFVRNGERVFLEARYFPEFDWYILAEQETGTTLGHLRFTLFTNLGIGLLATGLVILAVILVVNRYQGRLELLAATDDLTGIANRRHFIGQLRNEVARSDRYEEPVSLLMIDIDHFKQVNDSRGHLVGDRVLKELAEALREHVRESDVIGRLGGEEFGVILPHTEQDAATIVAERMRSSIASHAFSGSERARHTVTISVGVASRDRGHGDFEDLLKQADEAMYRAKAAGRNQVSS